MATKTTTTKSTKNKNGTKKTTTKVKDTSIKTGRQQTALEKKKLSNQGAAVATIGETIGGLVTTETNKAREATKREEARQKTYQSAINKWNGILKSTPEAAEGTNPGQDGDNNQNNSTGTNPWEGW